MKKIVLALTAFSLLAAGIPVMAQQTADEGTSISSPTCTTQTKSAKKHHCRHHKGKKAHKTATQDQ